MARRSPRHHNPQKGAEESISTPVALEATLEGESVESGSREEGQTAALVQASKEKAKKKRRMSNLIAVLCVLLGICIMSYPVVATLIMNKSQQDAVQQIRKNVNEKYSPSEREKMLAETDRYNTRLKDGPILDPFLARVAPDTPQYKYYLSLLDFGDSIMGSIKIPKINVDLPIYHGTYDYALDRGVGHLFGSSMPVGGINTHSVLTAHSGLGSATMFDNLPKLVKGDPIYLMVAGRTLKYEMIGSNVVVPTDTKTLLIEPGEDLVTLVTCTPYGINTHRLLVHFKRVELEETEAKVVEEQVYTVWQNWMWIPIIFTLVALLILFFPVRRRSKDIEKKALKAAKKAKHKALKSGAGEEEAEEVGKRAYEAVMVKYAPKLKKLRAKEAALAAKRAAKQDMRRAKARSRGFKKMRADEAALAAAASVVGEAAKQEVPLPAASTPVPAPSVSAEQTIPSASASLPTPENAATGSEAASGGEGEARPSRKEMRIEREQTQRLAELEEQDFRSQRGINEEN